MMVSSQQCHQAISIYTTKSNYQLDVSPILTCPPLTPHDCFLIQVTMALPWRFNLKYTLKSCVITKKLILIFLKIYILHELNSAPHDMPFPHLSSPPHIPRKYIGRTSISWRFWMQKCQVCQFVYCVQWGCLINIWSYIYIYIYINIAKVPDFKKKGYC